MALDPVKIPQNVYIEDRIVGPLTLKQTIIMTLGGGFSYTLFSMLQKTYGTPPLALSIMAWIPCAISVLFALVKINDLTLMRIMLLTIERISKAPVRTFAPRQGISLHIRFSTPTTEDNRSEKARAEDAHTEKKIRELSSLIDQPIQSLAPTPVADDDAAGPIIDDVQPPTAPALPPSSAMRQPPPAAPAAGPTPGPQLDGPTFSDLSVFRDVFSPPSQ